MGLSYSVKEKKWISSPERTDYPIAPIYKKMDVWVKYDKQPIYIKGNISGYSLVPTKVKVGVNITKNAEEGWQKIGNIPVDYDEGDIRKLSGFLTGLSGNQLAPEAYAASRKLQGENEINELQNEENAALNEKNIALNKAYENALPIISSTRGDDYVAQRDALKKLGIPNIEDNFKAFYLTEKLTPWNSDLGAKPQYGNFDVDYYKKNNPKLVQQYEDAVANDDIDILDRYGEEGFYLWHYTTQGKAAGQRGNAPEETKAVDYYVEKAVTDKDIQDVRNLQLGVDMQTADARLLSIPYISKQFENALNGDEYWKQMAKDNFLSIDTKKPEEFAALFRLSERPEDKEVAFNYQINNGQLYGITELEDVINQVVGEKATVDVKRFGALSQSVLKDTIEEMKKAKEREQMFDLMGQFSGFSEITNINKTLADSIIGSSGIGGVLPFMGQETKQDDLEKSLQGITGVRNVATYNWQQWFDKTLKEKYNKDLELGYTRQEAEEQVKISGDFAKEFIEKYLQPRFNTSRSMDEFVEYLDVRQEEQNPFQTQDLVNAVTQVANLRSKAYLDSIQKINDRYFNPDFYFNPTGDKGREADYLKQKNDVAKDWEAAKKGDKDWAEQAYRYGLDVNKKADFARLHFQVKGKNLGYDGAEDILNASKVTDEIYNKILPALEKEAFEQGSIFGQFITPEEFADEVLVGLDPNVPEAWQEVLDQFGAEDFTGDINDLKDYIAQVMRTGSAEEIRRQIKYLNEKGKRPTQELLGLTYIEREEDYKGTTKAETQLYEVFKNAGYSGTEDEFYETMFPDVDRTEQQLLTKAGTGKGLEFIDFDTSDPFASLGSIESFFQDEVPTEDDSDTKSTSDGFFSLDYEDDEDTKYKSATGERILSDFTSFFKGFS